MKTLEYGNGSSKLDRVFVVVPLRSTLSLRRWMAPPQNVNIEKSVKLGLFAPFKRQNIPIPKQFIG